MDENLRESNLSAPILVDPVAYARCAGACQSSHADMTPRLLEIHACSADFRQPCVCEDIGAPMLRFNLDQASTEKDVEHMYGR